MNLSPTARTKVLEQLNKVCKVMWSLHSLSFIDKIFSRHNLPPGEIKRTSLLSLLLPSCIVVPIKKLVNILHHFFSKLYNNL